MSKEAETGSSLIVSGQRLTRRRRETLLAPFSSTIRRYTSATNHVHVKGFPLCIGSSTFRAIMAPLLPLRIHTKPTRQHLYKRHRLPEYSCLRCFESFADNASLSDHSRSESLCDIREPIVVEGVSKQQEAELKKRSKNAHTESQKWVEVFLLLFPATSPRDVPSPCKSPLRGDGCWTNHADQGQMSVLKLNPKPPPY